MTNVRFCPSCGAARIEGARFCGGCGADLAAPGVPSVPFAPETEPWVPPVAHVAEAAAAPVAVRPTAGGSRPVRDDRPARRRSLLLVGLVLCLVIAVGVGVGAVLMLKPSSLPGEVAGSPIPNPAVSPSAVASNSNAGGPTPNPTNGYDGIFSPAGTMQWPRFLAATALLRDGTVLIAGGTSGPNSAGTLTSAEIFDPRTGTSTATGNMLEARAWDTATVLDDGRVLVVGGNSDPASERQGTCGWRRRHGRVASVVGRAVRPEDQHLDRYRELARGDV